jgi:hypothetical protein
VVVLRDSASNSLTVHGPVGWERANKFAQDMQALWKSEHPPTKTKTADVRQAHEMTRAEARRRGWMD